MPAWKLRTTITAANDPAYYGLNERITAAGCGLKGKLFPEQEGKPVALMSVRRIDSSNRKQADAFISSRWFSLQMVVHGTVYDLHHAEGYVSLSDDVIDGMVTYEITGSTMEILSLDSMHENRGTGTELLNAAIEEARKRDCRRIMLITTNDNMHALRFWQKRGFDLVGLYRNALDESRKLKPAIPMTGIDGIPLKHEIKLEMYL